MALASCAFLKHRRSHRTCDAKSDADEIALITASIVLPVAAVIEAALRTSKSRLNVNGAVSIFVKSANYLCEMYFAQMDLLFRVALFESYCELSTTTGTFLYKIVSFSTSRAFSSTSSWRIRQYTHNDLTTCSAAF